MDEREHLNALISEYKFNESVLSRYLGILPEQVLRLAKGDMTFLPDDNKYRFDLFNRIDFLYFSAIEDKDVKLTAFLQVLVSYHHLSKETIAKMAGVTDGDIEKLLSDPPEDVSMEVKYKIAITVMALRFFLKDCEQNE